MTVKRPSSKCYSRSIPKDAISLATRDGDVTRALFSSRNANTEPQTHAEAHRENNPWCVQLSHLVAFEYFIPIFFVLSCWFTLEAGDAHLCGKRKHLRVEDKAVYFFLRLLFLQQDQGESCDIPPRRRSGAADRRRPPHGYLWTWRWRGDWTCSSDLSCLCSVCTTPEPRPVRSNSTIPPSHVDLLIFTFFLHFADSKWHI